MLLGRLDYHITAEFIRIAVDLLFSLASESDDSVHRSARATLHQVRETPLISYEHCNTELLADHELTI
jgi:hypothetical protein